MYMYKTRVYKIIVKPDKLLANMNTVIIYIHNIVMRKMSHFLIENCIKCVDILPQLHIQTNKCTQMNYYYVQKIIAHNC